MYAIVLSCDSHHLFAYHTLLTYEKMWNSNKFIFRIPWNNIYPEYIKNKFGDKVELIKTPVEFKKTIEGLIEDIDDDEWIYWCFCDQYLESIIENKANIMFEFVKNQTDKKVIGITGSVPFLIKRKKMEAFNSNSKTITFKGLNFKERTKWNKSNYISIWFHQFFRKKLLYKIFYYFKEPTVAKNLDYQVNNNYGLLKDKIWNDSIMYSLDKDIYITGESSSRGKILKNCFYSFKKYNLEIPNKFKYWDKVQYWSIFYPNPNLESEIDFLNEKNIFVNNFLIGFFSDMKIIKDIKKNKLFSNLDMIYVLSNNKRKYYRHQLLNQLKKIGIISNVRFLCIKSLRKIFLKKDYLKIYKLVNLSIDDFQKLNQEQIIKIEKYISQTLCYKDAMDNNYKNILILNDDHIFNENKIDVINKINLDSIKNLYDICYLDINKELNLKQTNIHYFFKLLNEDINIIK